MDNARVVTGYAIADARTGRWWSCSRGFIAPSWTVAWTPGKIAGLGPADFRPLLEDDHDPTWDVRVVDSRAEAERLLAQVAKYDRLSIFDGSSEPTIVELRDVP